MTRPEVSPPRLSGDAALSGVGVLVIGRLAEMIMSFLAAAVLARLLTPAEFGVVAGAFVVIALADAIFDGAFGVGMVQRRGLDDKYVATTLTLSLILSLIIWGAVTASAPLVQAFFDFPDLAGVLSLTGLIIVFKALASPSKALLQRQHRFRLLAIIPVVAYAVGYGFVAIGLAVAGMGVWSLAWGALVTGIIDGITPLLFARIPLRPHLSRKLVREVFDTSGYFTLSQVLNWAALAGANVVVGRYLGASQLGIYSRGWKLLTVVTSATATPLSRVLLPVFSRVQDDLPTARRAFMSGLSLSLPLFAAASVIFTVHADAMIRIALGDGWQGAVPVVQVLFLSLLPRCAYKLSDSVAYGMGRSLSATIRQAIYAVLMIGGAIVAVPHGAVAVALAASVGIWASYLISMAYAQRLLSTSWLQLAVAHLRAVILVAPAAVVDLGLGRALEPMGFWPSQVVGGAAGVAVLLAMFIFAPEFLTGSVWAARRKQIIERGFARLSRTQGRPTLAPERRP